MNGSEIDTKDDELIEEPNIENSYLGASKTQNSLKNILTIENFTDNLQESYINLEAVKEQNMIRHGSEEDFLFSQLKVSKNLAQQSPRSPKPFLDYEDLRNSQESCKLDRKNSLINIQNDKLNPNRKLLKLNSLLKFDTDESKKNGKEKGVFNREPEKEMTSEQMSKEKAAIAHSLGLINESEITEYDQLLEFMVLEELPYNYVKEIDPDGKLIFFNKVDKISSYDHPLINKFRHIFYQKKFKEDDIELFKLENRKNVPPKFTYPPLIRYNKHEHHQIARKDSLSIKEQNSNASSKQDILQNEKAIKEAQIQKQRAQISKSVYKMKSISGKIAKSIGGMGDISHKQKIEKIEQIPAVPNLPVINPALMFTEVKIGQLNPKIDSVEQRYKDMLNELTSMKETQTQKFIKDRIYSQSNYYEDEQNNENKNQDKEKENVLQTKELTISNINIYHKALLRNDLKGNNKGGDKKNKQKVSSIIRNGLGMFSQGSTKTTSIKNIPQNTSASGFELSETMIQNNSFTQSQDGVDGIGQDDNGDKSQTASVLQKRESNISNKRNEFSRSRLSESKIKQSDKEEIIPQDISQQQQDLQNNQPSDNNQIDIYSIRNDRENQLEIIEKELILATLFYEEKYGKDLFIQQQLIEQQKSYLRANPEDVISAMKFLNIQLDEPKLFWVARAFASLDLPDFWTEIYEEDECQIVYVNQLTNFHFNIHPSIIFLQKIISKYKLSIEQEQLKERQQKLAFKPNSYLFTAQYPKQTITIEHVNSNNTNNSKLKRLETHAEASLLYTSYNYQEEHTMNFENKIGKPYIVNITKLSQKLEKIEMYKNDQLTVPLTNKLEYISNTLNNVRRKEARQIAPNNPYFEDIYFFIDTSHENYDNKIEEETMNEHVYKHKRRNSNLSDQHMLVLSNELQLRFPDDAHVLILIHEFLEQKEQANKNKDWRFRSTNEKTFFWYNPTELKSQIYYPYLQQLKDIVSLFQISLKRDIQSVKINKKGFQFLKQFDHSKGNIYSQIKLESKEFVKMYIQNNSKNSQKKLYQDQQSNEDDIDYTSSSSLENSKKQTTYSEKQTEQDKNNQKNGYKLKFVMDILRNKENMSDATIKEQILFNWPLKFKYKESNIQDLNKYNNVKLADNNQDKIKKQKSVKLNFDDGQKKILNKMKAVGKLANMTKSNSKTDVLKSPQNQSDKSASVQLISKNQQILTTQSSNTSIGGGQTKSAISSTSLSSTSLVSQSMLAQKKINPPTSYQVIQNPNYFQGKTSSDIYRFNSQISSSSNSSNGNSSNSDSELDEQESELTSSFQMKFYRTQNESSSNIPDKMFLQKIGFPQDQQIQEIQVQDNSNQNQTKLFQKKDNQNNQGQQIIKQSDDKVQFIKNNEEQNKNFLENGDNSNQESYDQFNYDQLLNSLESYSPTKQTDNNKQQNPNMSQTIDSINNQNDSTQADISHEMNKTQNSLLKKKHHSTKSKGNKSTTSFQKSKNQSNSIKETKDTKKVQDKKNIKGLKNKTNEQNSPSTLNTNNANMNNKGQTNKQIFPKTQLDNQNHKVHQQIVNQPINNHNNNNNNINNNLNKNKQNENAQNNEQQQKSLPQDQVFPDQVKIQQKLISLLDAQNEPANQELNQNVITNNNQINFVIKESVNEDESQSLQSPKQNLHLIDESQKQIFDLQYKLDVSESIEPQDQQKAQTNFAENSNDSVAIDNKNNKIDNILINQDNITDSLNLGENEQKTEINTVQQQSIETQVNERQENQIQNIKEQEQSDTQKKEQIHIADMSQITESEEIKLQNQSDNLQNSNLSEQNTSPNQNSRGGGESPFSPNSPGNSKIPTDRRSSFRWKMVEAQKNVQNEPEPIKQTAPVTKTDDIEKLSLSKEIEDSYKNLFKNHFKDKAKQMHLFTKEYEKEQQKQIFKYIKPELVIQEKDEEELDEESMEDIQNEIMYDSDQFCIDNNKHREYLQKQTNLNKNLLLPNQLDGIFKKRQNNLQHQNNINGLFSQLQKVPQNNLQLFSNRGSIFNNQQERKFKRESLAYCLPEVRSQQIYQNHELRNQFYQTSIQQQKLQSEITFVDQFNNILLEKKTNKDSNNIQLPEKYKQSNITQQQQMMNQTNKGQFKNSNNTNAILFPTLQQPTKKLIPHISPKVRLIKNPDSVKFKLNRSLSPKNVQENSINPQQYNPDRKSYLFKDQVSYKNIPLNSEAQNNIFSKQTSILDQLPKRSSITQYKTNNRSQSPIKQDRPLKGNYYSNKQKNLVPISFKKEQKTQNLEKSLIDSSSSNLAYKFQENIENISKYQDDYSNFKIKSMLSDLLKKMPYVKLDFQKKINSQILKQTSSDIKNKMNTYQIFQIEAQAHLELIKVKFLKRKIDIIAFDFIMANIILPKEAKKTIYDSEILKARFYRKFKDIFADIRNFMLNIDDIQSNLQRMIVDQKFEVRVLSRLFPIMQKHFENQIMKMNRDNVFEKIILFYEKKKQSKKKYEEGEDEFDNEDDEQEQKNEDEKLAEEIMLSDAESDTDNRNDLNPFCQQFTLTTSKVLKKIIFDDKKKQHKRKKLIRKLERGVNNFKDSDEEKEYLENIKMYKQSRKNKINEGDEFEDKNYSSQMQFKKTIIHLNQLRLEIEKQNQKQMEKEIKKKRKKFMEQEDDDDDEDEDYDAFDGESQNKQKKSKLHIPSNSNTESSDSSFLSSLNGSQDSDGKQDNEDEVSKFNVLLKVFDNPKYIFLFQSFLQTQEKICMLEENNATWKLLVQQLGHIHTLFRNSTKRVEVFLDYGFTTEDFEQMIKRLNINVIREGDLLWIAYFYCGFLLRFSSNKSNQVLSAILNCQEKNDYDLYFKEMLELNRVKRQFILFDMNKKNQDDYLIYSQWFKFYSKKSGQMFFYNPILQKKITHLNNKVTMMQEHFKAIEKYKFIETIDFIMNKIRDEEEKDLALQFNVMFNTPGNKDQDQNNLLDTHKRSILQYKSRNSIRGSIIGIIESNPNIQNCISTLIKN